MTCWECVLSFRDIATCIGWNPTTTIRIWNRYVQESYTERYTWSQWFSSTNTREDRHNVSSAFQQSYSTNIELKEACLQHDMFTRHLLVQTVRRRLHKHVLSAQRLLPLLQCHWLPLALQQRSCGDSGTRNDKTGYRSASTSYFQISPGSACNIEMDISMSQGIEENAHGLLAFDIVK